MRNHKNPFEDPSQIPIIFDSVDSVKKVESTSKKIPAKIFDYESEYSYLVKLSKEEELLTKEILKQENLESLKKYLKEEKGISFVDEIITGDFEKQMLTEMGNYVLHLSKQSKFNLSKDFKEYIKTNQIILNGAIAHEEDLVNPSHNEDYGHEDLD